MMDFIANNWLLIIMELIMGLFIGLLTGLFGAGGGFILTPALNIIVGMPYNLAVGTSTCQILGTSGLSLYHHQKQTRKLSGVKIAFLIGLGIPIGSYVGVRSVDYLKNMGNITVAGKTILAQQFYFTVFFCVFLLLISGWLLLDNFYLRRHVEDDDNHKGLLAVIKISPMMKFPTIPHGTFSAPVLPIMGLGVGFLSGLLGIGGGVIMMPMLFYLIGQEVKNAAQTSTMLIFMSGLFSSFFHAANGNIVYITVIVLMGGAFFGTKIGAKIQKDISGKSIRKYFAFVVLAAALMVIYKLWVIIARAPVISP